MIRLVEALNYRCLRYVRQPLDRFHVLVGPNASGKSTFLDVFAFLSRLVSDGVDAAVRERTSNFYDLVWGRDARRIEMGIEATIPDRAGLQGNAGSFDTIRYKVAIGSDEENDELRILRQQIWLATANDGKEDAGSPGPQELPGSLFGSGSPGNAVALHRHTGTGAFWLVPEAWAHEARPQSDDHYWIAVGALNHKRTLFTGLPSQGDFPASTWLGELLANGVSPIELSSAKLRRPSPPGSGSVLEPDGSNLAWVVSKMRESAPQRFGEWLAHVRTAMPDLQGIRTVDRPEEHSRYLMLRYRDGLEVPSWMVSEGTLHLLALTALAYSSQGSRLYLIEEPENSLHPLNIEAIMQSLQSVYDGQVLVATHSPLVVGLAEPKDVLVFSRDEKSGTSITIGSEHPGLRDWRGEVSLGTLFAGGVLG